MTYTVKNIAHAREMMERARRNMARVREKTEGAIETGIEIAEVSAVAMGLGYVNSQWGGDAGEVTIAGVPLDLGLAVVLHGTAFLGGLGKYSDHAHSIANGALAAFAYRTGFQVAAKRAPHQLPPHVGAGALYPAPQWNAFPAPAPYAPPMDVHGMPVPDSIPRSQ